ncbi:MAG: acyl-CoA/acyl-ACP dehydrogenase [Deltaproteobacteria bacterium]|nr:acyl-CoA/acyl-ACP dehydrogenase [Deltaproteobacteria bacterium]
MDLDFSEEQRILMKAARDFLQKESPKSLVREMRENEIGYPAHLWKRMAELGWLGVIIPEEFGGTGGTFLDLAIILEAMGEACLPGPYFSTAVLGSTAILLAGTGEQKDRLLPQVAEGELILAFALSEPGSWYGSTNIQTTAVKDGENYVIDGVKHFVENAHAADKIICAAQVKEKNGDDAGLKLFLVDGSNPGVRIKPFKTLGYEKQCEVVFDSVRVKKDDVLGAPAETGQIILTIEERAAVAKCAEMIGALQSSFSMTVASAAFRLFSIIWPIWPWIWTAQGISPIRRPGEFPRGCQPALNPLWPRLSPARPPAE